MPTEIKVLVLSLTADERAALNHELSEPYGHEIRIGIFEKCRAALNAEQEEQREYRLLYDVRAYGKDIGTYETVLADPSSLAEAEERLESAGPGKLNVRIQFRTITQLQDGQFISEWRDLEEGE